MLVLSTLRLKLGCALTMFAVVVLKVLDIGFISIVVRLSVCEGVWASCRRDREEQKRLRDLNMARRGKHNNFSSSNFLSLVFVCLTAGVGRLQETQVRGGSDIAVEEGMTQPRCFRLAIEARNFVWWSQLRSSNTLRCMNIQIIVRLDPLQIR